MFHTKKCLAHAIICAVENLRDASGMTDLDFRLYMQDGEALGQADMYLETGTTTCICNS